MYEKPTWLLGFILGDVGTPGAPSAVPPNTRLCRCLGLLNRSAGRGRAGREPAEMSVSWLSGVKQQSAVVQWPPQVQRQDNCRHSRHHFPPLSWAFFRPS